MIRYERTIVIPEYGIEVAITRTHGQRWWAVGTSDLPGNARARARARKPRGALAITAYVTSEPSFKLSRARSRKRRGARALN